jgi:hypothetical protein
VRPSLLIRVNLPSEISHIEALSTKYAPSALREEIVQ